MPAAVQLSRQEVRRALADYHFEPVADPIEAFHRLRSIQFDPIAPAGCNHDLVLQARVPGYRVGDWEPMAYEHRLIYDGWDKQASLVPYEGWPLRRFFHTLYRGRFERILNTYPDTVKSILGEIEQRGPLRPADSDCKERRDDWKESWHGPSVAKQILRVLWHHGTVMVSSRQKGQHVYDLTERIVPESLRSQPVLTDEEARAELVRERHLAVGVVRKSAPPEVWSYTIMGALRTQAFHTLLDSESIVPVDIEGVAAHASHQFLDQLDKPRRETNRLVFVAPLDQILWDRKMIAHLYDFDYVWEIYTPLKKRRWGYYVLPVLFDDQFVARIEFWCRKGLLEVRGWMLEGENLGPDFYSELETAMRRFMSYCGASRVKAATHLDSKFRDLVRGIR